MAIHFWPYFDDSALLLHLLQAQSKSDDPYGSIMGLMQDMYEVRLTIHYLFLTKHYVTANIHSNLQCCNVPGGRWQHEAHRRWKHDEVPLRSGGNRSFNSDSISKTQLSATTRRKEHLHAMPVRHLCLHLPCGSTWETWTPKILAVTKVGLWHPQQAPLGGGEGDFGENVSNGNAHVQLAIGMRLGYIHLGASLKLALRTSLHWNLESYPSACPLCMILRVKRKQN